MQMTFGALPFAGGLLDQPYALMVIVGELRTYAEQYAKYHADPKNASPALRSRVLLMAAASVEN